MKQFVTAQPFISTTIIGGEHSEIDHPYLILACDGMWDVFSDQEAVDFLNEKIEANGGQPVQEAAEILVQYTINRFVWGLSLCLC